MIAKGVFEKTMAGWVCHYSYSVTISAFGLLVGESPMVLFKPVLRLVSSFDDDVGSACEIHIAEIKKELQELVIVDIVMESIQRIVVFTEIRVGPEDPTGSEYGLGAQIASRYVDKHWVSRQLVDCLALLVRIWASVCKPAGARQRFVFWIDGKSFVTIVVDIRCISAEAKYFREVIRRKDQTGGKTFFSEMVDRLGYIQLRKRRFTERIYGATQFVRVVTDRHAPHVVTS